MTREARMMGQSDLMTENDVEPEYERRAALAAAYQQVHDAYQRARRLVYDAYPDGLPLSAELTRMQQAALDDSTAADNHLEELRKESAHGLKAT